VVIGGASYATTMSSVKGGFRYLSLNPYIFLTSFVGESQSTKKFGSGSLKSSGD